jgi:hypothetical protein
METPQNENNIRLACRHLMVDLDLVRKGSYAVILPRLSEKMGKPININTLIMSLNGYRTGPAYQELLTVLHDLLKNWPKKAA